MAPLESALGKCMRQEGLLNAAEKVAMLSAAWRSCSSSSSSSSSSEKFATRSCVMELLRAQSLVPSTAVGLASEGGLALALRAVSVVTWSEGEEQLRLAALGAACLSSLAAAALGAAQPEPTGFSETQTKAKTKAGAEAEADVAVAAAAAAAALHRARDGVVAALVEVVESYATQRAEAGASHWGSPGHAPRSAAAAQLCTQACQALGHVLSPEWRTGLREQQPEADHSVVATDHTNGGSHGSSWHQRQHVLSRVAWERVAAAVVRSMAVKAFPFPAPRFGAGSELFYWQCVVLHNIR
jgi:hypothetical protein